MTDPVEKQNIVQDPNPFTILGNDEDSENEDDKAQQFLLDQIKNQGAEDAINAKKIFLTKPGRSRSAPASSRSEKVSQNRGARTEVEDVPEGDKSDDK